MGGVGNFLFGGSSNKNTSTQSTNSNSASYNQNNSNSAQASSNVSNQDALSASNQYNQAYAPTAAAMAPTLGYTAQAGNAIAQLLGLPASSAAPVPSTPFTPTAIPTSLPTAPATAPGLGSIVSQITGAAPAPAAPTTVHPPVIPTPTPAPGPGSGTHIPPGGRWGHGSPSAAMEYRAQGGPVAAGQPVVVGEHQPEVFVPQQAGNVVPTGTPDGRVAPPGAPPPPLNPGLNNFANSDGMNFIANQGQQAISGASAGNGTFDSGATGKALVNYGQGIGQKYLDDYMGNLFNYAKLGLGGASAMSGAGGVGTSGSVSQGSSIGTSGGISSGTGYGMSSGTTNSSGTASGSGSSKKGLLPDIAAFS